MRRHDNVGEAMLLLLVVLAILAAGVWIVLGHDISWGPAGGY